MENKKIIEFNGDFWHANPLIFKENDIHPVFKKPCKDRWKLDEEKINIANSFGYEVLIVWEKEYIDNKDFVLKKCFNFLNK
jgi:hypothetical protein